MIYSGVNDGRALLDSRRLRRVQTLAVTREARSIVRNASPTIWQAPDGELVERLKVGPVVDGSLPEVQPAPSDVNGPNSPEVTAPQPSGTIPTQAAPRKRRRRPGAALFTVLKKLWIPLVILIVVGAGGFTVSRLHGIFGSDNSIPYGDTATDEGPPVNPKYLKYEIFGPPGTVAQISFFNENGDPQFLEAVPLPWSLEFPITGAAGIGSIAAQGDSDSLGCRILVDGVVKDEKLAEHEASTFTSCMLKAA